MLEQKEAVAASIAKAQADLVEALTELERTPAFEAGSVAFSAHALNNYLFVIGGTVELMSTHVAKLHDPQLKIWLDGLQHATDLMMRTVSQLMSATASSDAKLRFDEVDLALLVQRACQYYQRRADPKRIRLSFEAQPETLSVRTDRVAVAAVLDNLLSNAVKYSPRGSQIHVQVRVEDGWAVCEVRDQGPGLSEADQAKLFRRGSRLTPQPTGGEPSMGYGLAVAKELIDKLHGKIGCQCTLGQGCTFYFRLPVKP